MAKKGGLLSGVLGAAAVAGAAKVISDLEKQAKDEGKDILDVAKDKLDDIVEDVKSGDLQKSLTDKVNDLVEDAKSGELVNNLKDKAQEVIKDVQTEEFKQKASETLTNLKDGVVDILDGKENKA